MRLIIALAFVLLVFIACSHAAVLHVNSDGYGDFATIQEALNAVTEGDTVYLADGRYTGKGNYNIVFPDGEILLASASGDPRKCIIDCESLDRAFVFGEFRSCSGNVFISGAPPPHYRHRATIKGITITNGYSDMGGAVLCNKFTEPTFVDCLFIGNHSLEKGGAFHFIQSEAVLINCILAKNTSDIEGGAISQVCCSAPKFINCTIVHNHAPVGAGIQLTRSSIPVLTRSIIAFNGPGEGISCTGMYGNCKIRVRGSNIYSNQGGNIHDCNVKDELDAGFISSDPLFVNPQLNDYRLQVKSPCNSVNTDDGELIGAIGAEWPY